MLDIKFVRDNIEEVQKNIEKRSVKADAQLVVDLYKKKNELQLEIDELRKARNDNAAKMKRLFSTKPLLQLSLVKAQP